MEKEILGFERKYANEKKEKRTQGHDGRIIRYHTFNNILASKLVLVVSVEKIEEVINFIEQTKSKVWKCQEDADEFEDALAFLRKRLIKKQ